MGGRAAEQVTFEFLPALSDLEKSQNKLAMVTVYG
jgi:hypothetical protein